MRTDRDLTPDPRIITELVDHMPASDTVPSPLKLFGRIPGTRRYSDLERHPDNEEVPGILIFRTEASLLYFNTEHVRGAVWTKLQAAQGLGLVVCDLSDAPFVDVAGARMLAGLHRELTAVWRGELSPEGERLLAVASAGPGGRRPGAP